jgi:hypothetical protein
MTAAFARCYADNRFQRSVDVWDIMERYGLPVFKDQGYRKFVMFMSLAMEREAVSGWVVFRQVGSNGQLLPGLGCDFGVRILTNNADDNHAQYPIDSTDQRELCLLLPGVICPGSGTPCSVCIHVDASSDYPRRQSGLRLQVANVPSHAGGQD